MAIPNNTITHAHVGEIQQEFKAGMRAEDFPHIANLLINLYSDPTEAVVREYSTNALDSHIAAGVRRPIEITLPTRDNLEFVVQDWGLGLSVDDLRDVYSMYGRSLKRESDDMVGQLGLGCKSGLTYADAFTIVAIKDGVKTVAMSTKDEHGVGTIKVLDTVGTTEPNGVRITIPVRNGWDADEFVNAAEHLFQFWDEGTVLIDGEAPDVPEWKKVGLSIDNDIMVVPLNAGLHHSYVVMGNVAYQVKDASAPGDAKRRNVKDLRFVARINMGDVDFVPSREAVHYTNWTNETLSDLNEYIHDRFDRVLAARLADSPTRWDETLLKVLWRGSHMGLNTTQDTPIWAYEPNSYSKRKASAYVSYRFNLLTNTTTVVITGFPNKSLSTSHRKMLLAEYPGTRLYVVVPDSVDTTGLKGRTNTFNWADITAKNNSPKAKAARVKRDETKYTVVTGDGVPRTAAELAKLDKVLWLDPKGSTNFGTFDDATIIQLYSSNQIDRLKRLAPGIKWYMDEVRDQIAATEAALTYNDRLVAQASQLPKPYSKLDPDQIDDPDLAQMIRMSKLTPSETANKAKRLKVSIIPSGWNHPSEIFGERYPIIRINQYYHYTDEALADTALYINAKYAAEQQKNLDAALDAAAS